jgi:hypothetical protein
VTEGDHPPPAFSSGYGQKGPRLENSLILPFSCLTDKSPDPSVHADEEAVMQAFLTGNPVDPLVAQRVQERGHVIRQEVLRKHGLVDIAVPAIRELRGPLP